MKISELEGYELAGRFKLKHLLGKGGYGAVFAAEQISVGRMCAVKVLVPHLTSDPATVSRFKREARSTSKLAHPNTIVLYDFGLDEDLNMLFLVMEYLKGATLDELIKSEGTFDVSSTLHILEQAAASLDDAARIGLVHRDVKPHNIMVTSRGNDDHFVKVIDFGIAKALRGDDIRASCMGLTQTGTIVGTPQYMSPEQIRDEPLDGRSDQYSLAVCAYAMLTGNVPFTGSSPIDVASRHLIDTPLPVTALEPNLTVSPIFEQALLKALSKDPEERFETSSAMVDALRAAVDPSIIMAEPTPQVPSGDFDAEPPEVDDAMAPGDQRPSRESLETVRVGGTSQVKSSPDSEAATALVGVADVTDSETMAPKVAVEDGLEDSGGQTTRPEVEPTDAVLADALPPNTGADTGPPEPTTEEIGSRLPPDVTGAIEPAQPEERGLGESPSDVRVDGTLPELDLPDSPGHTLMVDSVAEFDGPSTSVERAAEGSTGLVEKPESAPKKVRWFLIGIPLFIGVVVAGIMLATVGSEGDDPAQGAENPEGVVSSEPNGEAEIGEPGIAVEAQDSDSVEPEPEPSQDSPVLRGDTESAQDKGGDTVQAGADTPSDPPSEESSESVAAAKKEEAEPDEPEKKKEVGYATLNVTLIPWGELWIGRKKYGSTPRQSVRVKAGRHRLRLRQNGETRATETVDVGVGDSKMVVLKAR